MSSAMLVKALASLALAAPAAAHLSMWHPSMYGFGDSYEPVVPLSNELGTGSFSQWWFHGFLNQPPAEGVFAELPAGGTFNTQVGCIKDVTTYNGRQNQELACDSWGSIHLAGSTDRGDVKGCAIAIAYNSDVHSIKPEDFTVISVNADCPYTRDVGFEIPAGLPECPPGGCHCQWGWIHSAMGGGNEMYFTGFKCKVTGASPDAKPVPQGVAPTKGGGAGPKQPIYWVVDRANVFSNEPPQYGPSWGFSNGAQNDIWNGVGGNTAVGSGGNSSSNSGSNSGSSSGSRPNSGSETSSNTPGSTPSNANLAADHTDYTEPPAATDSTPTDTGAGAYQTPAENTDNTGAQAPSSSCKPWDANATGNSWGGGHSYNRGGNRGGRRGGNRNRNRDVKAKGQLRSRARRAAAEAAQA